MRSVAAVHPVVLGLRHDALALCAVLFLAARMMVFTLHLKLDASQRRNRELEDDLANTLRQRRVAADWLNTPGVLVGVNRRDEDGPRPQPFGPFELQLPKAMALHASTRGNPLRQGVKFFAEGSPVMDDQILVVIKST